MNAVGWLSLFSLSPPPLLSLSLPVTLSLSPSPLPLSPLFETLHVKPYIASLSLSLARCRALPPEESTAAQMHRAAGSYARIRASEHQSLLLTRAEFAQPQPQGWRQVGQGAGGKEREG